MSEASAMFCQLTFNDLCSATSSPESEYGQLRLVPLDGPTTAPYGLDHAHANLSPASAKEKGLLTSGTFGPIGSGSSTTRDLTRSLASKLRARTTGSILYGVTWKQSVTPSGALKFQARASARRTSVPAIIGWRTCQESDGEGGIMEIRPGCSGRYKLRDEVMLSGWPTPLANKLSPQTREDFTPNLAAIAELAGWPTPVTFDAKESSNPEPIIKRRGKLQAKHKNGNGCGLNLAQCVITQVAFPTDSGLEVILSNGSIVAMKSGARLNPAHSRWLQTIPPQWDDFAPMATRSTLERRRSSSAPTWNASASEEKDKP
jgi:hypothetical protein